MGGHLPFFNFFFSRCALNLGAVEFIFKEWEKENELVFCMCLLRTTTWGAARHGRDVSDRGPCFRKLGLARPMGMLSPSHPCDLREGPCKKATSPESLLLGTTGGSAISGQHQCPVQRV